jgi:hypothetical protein
VIRAEIHLSAQTNASKALEPVRGYFGWKANDK